MISFNTSTFSPKFADIATALALLTRLPVRARFDRSAQAAWAFPIVGAVVAALSGLVALILGWFGVSSGVAVAFAMACMVVMTGAIHEDGLADTADGLWGAWDKDRRLEIMRDSHIGTYGVLGLGLVLVTRFEALTVLAYSGHLISGLIAAAALSRAAMPYVMVLLPHARSDGLSVKTGRPTRHAASFGALMAFFVSWVAVGFVPTVVAGLVVAAVTAGVMAIAKSKIGGQTGDILGATQVVCDIAALAVFTMFV